MCTLTLIAESWQMKLNIYPPYTVWPAFTVVTQNEPIDNWNNLFGNFEVMQFFKKESLERCFFSGTPDFTYNIWCIIHFFQ